MSDHDSDSLLEKARRVQMSPADAEKQRRSFAYGNAHIENKNVTQETVDRAAEAMKAKGSECSSG